MKVLTTYHPSWVRKGNWKYLHLLKEDLQRAAEEATRPELELLPIHHNTSPTPSEALSVLRVGDARPLCLDIEAVRRDDDGFVVGDILCIGVSREPGQAVVLPNRPPFTAMLREALMDPSSPKVGQNLGFDFPRLRDELGLPDIHFIRGPWEDTLEKHVLCYSDLPHNLEEIASVYYDRHPWKAAHRRGEVSLEAYNAHDVDATIRTNIGLDERMVEFGVDGLWKRITQRAIPVMIHMSETGLGIDLPRQEVVRSHFQEVAVRHQSIIDSFVRQSPRIQVLSSQLKRAAELLVRRAEPLSVPGTKRRANKMRTKARKIQERAEKLLSVNPLSKKDVPWLLFDQLGMPRKKGDSTDEDVIVTLIAASRFVKPEVDPLFVPLLKAILDYRKATRLVGTYLSHTTPTVHPRFLMWGTGTGRLSSRDPNAQNIPHRDEEAWMVRTVYIPSIPGWEVSEIDYKQLERRIQAIRWNDAMLRRAYAEGLDTHTFTAALVWSVVQGEPVAMEAITSQQRYLTKRLVYGTSYGMREDKFRRELVKDGIYLSYGEVSKLFKALAEATPGVTAGQTAAVQAAAQENVLRTVFGRIRWFLGPGAHGDAMNFDPQGTAADIILERMADLYEAGGRGPTLVTSAGIPFKLAAQVHDALWVFHPRGRGPEVIEFVRGFLERPVPELENTSFPTDSTIGWPNLAFREVDYDS